MGLKDDIYQIYGSAGDSAKFNTHVDATRIGRGLYCRSNSPDDMTVRLAEINNIKIGDKNHNTSIKQKTTLTIDATLITANVISVDVNSTTISETFATDNDTTMTAFASSIQAETGILSATASDVGTVGYYNTITIISEVGASNVFDNESVTLGVSQANITNTEVVQALLDPTNTYATVTSDGEILIDMSTLHSIITDTILLYAYTDTNDYLAFGVGSVDNGDFTSGDPSTYALVLDPMDYAIAEITTTVSMTEITQTNIKDVRMQSAELNTTIQKWMQVFSFFIFSDDYNNETISAISFSSIIEDSNYIYAIGNAFYQFDATTNLYYNALYKIDPDTLTIIKTIYFNSNLYEKCNLFAIIGNYLYVSVYDTSRNAYLVKIDKNTLTINLNKKFNYRIWTDARHSAYDNNHMYISSVVVDPTIDFRQRIIKIDSNLNIVDEIQLPDIVFCMNCINNSLYVNLPITTNILVIDTNSFSIIYQRTYSGITYSIIKFFDYNNKIYFYNQVDIGYMNYDLTDINVTSSTNASLSDVSVINNKLIATSLNSTSNKFRIFELASNLSINKAKDTEVPSSSPYTVVLINNTSINSVYLQLAVVGMLDPAKNIVTVDTSPQSVYLFRFTDLISGSYTGENNFIDIADVSYSISSVSGTSTLSSVSVTSTSDATLTVDTSVIADTQGAFYSSLYDYIINE